MWANHRPPQCPPTCQVTLQGGWVALVPTVAAEEEKPDKKGGQHQKQNPEEPGHGWVRDGPGRQDIHAEVCREQRTSPAESHYVVGLIPWVRLQLSAWMGCSRLVPVQPRWLEQQQPQMDTSCSRRSPAQTSAHVSPKCVTHVCESLCMCLLCFTKSWKSVLVHKKQFRGVARS